MAHGPSPARQPVTRYAAPAEDGGTLAVPPFEQIAALVQNNRTILEQAPAPIAAFRRQARDELRQLLGIPTEGPIILTGHQPELFHPGVWAKNFAAAGIAERLGGTAVNLVVDSDLVRDAKVPLPGQAHAAIAIDEPTGVLPYEQRQIQNPALAAAFGERLAAATAGWPFRPIGIEAWTQFPAGETNLGRLLAGVRQGVERNWGLQIVDLPMSRLAALKCFAAFFGVIAGSLERLRTIYNRALASYRRAHKLRSRNHPARDLAEGVLPFWRMTAAGRVSAMPGDPPHELRPKALLLTLFARLVLGDLFIHGIGGGLYDEATDSIIREFFGMQPPAFQVVTGTLHLPFTLPPAADLRHLQRLSRDLHWNPQRHISESHPLAARHRELMAMRPATSRERKARFHEFQKFREALRPLVEEQRLAVEDDITHALAVERVRSVFLRRDFAWVLYPESVLRPFLERLRQGC